MAPLRVDSVRIVLGDWVIFACVINFDYYIGMGLLDLSSLSGRYMTRISSPCGCTAVKCEKPCI